jgi:ParB family chromosome partitioning protein
MEGRIREFGGNLATIFDDNVAEASDSNFIALLSIDRIRPREDQPRKQFDEASLNELAVSIKANGVIQPIIVRKRDDGLYELIVGERRWRAATKAGLTAIPAIVKDYNRKDVMSVSLIENIQRENLNPIEEAMAIHQLIAEFSMTHNQVAESIGKSRATVTNLLRLLGLHDAVKIMLKDGLLEMGHARALLTLEEAEQLLAAHQVIDKKLSVRETEKLVQRIKTLPLMPAVEYQDIALKQKTQYWNDILTKRLSSKVRIQFNDKGEGKLVIHVNSPEEAEWLVEHIKVE